MGVWMHLGRGDKGPSVKGWVLGLVVLLCQTTLLRDGMASPRFNLQEHRAQRFAFCQRSYDAFIVDPSDARLLFLFRDNRGKRLGSLGKLRDYMADQNRELVFATNGGMFNPRFEPNGLFVSEGETFQSLNLSSGKGNFYLKPNGVFLIGDGHAKIMPSDQYPKYAGSVRFATQSGPLLLQDGKIHPGFNPRSRHRFVRNGVGLLKNEQLVFVISRQPVNFYQFAEVFRDYFGCEQALFLDGGISKMYLPALQRHDLEGDFAVVIALSK